MSSPPQASEAFNLVPLLETRIRQRISNAKQLDKAIVETRLFDAWFRKRFPGLWRALAQQSQVEWLDPRLLVLRACQDADTLKQADHWRALIVDLCEYGERHWGWEGAAALARKALPPEKIAWDVEQVKLLTIAPDFLATLQQRYIEKKKGAAKVDQELVLMVFMLTTGITQPSSLVRWLAVTTFQHDGVQGWILQNDERDPGCRRRLLSPLAKECLDDLRGTAWIKNAESIRVKLDTYLTRTFADRPSPTNYSQFKTLIQAHDRLTRTELIGCLRSEALTAYSLPTDSWLRNIEGIYPSAPKRKEPRCLTWMQRSSATEQAPSEVVFTTLIADFRERQSNAAFLRQYEARLHAANDWSDLLWLMIAWVCELVRDGSVQKTVLKPETILTYLYAIRPLLAHWTDFDLLALSEERFVERAFELFEKAESKNQRQALRLFFYFVDRQDHYDELDLSWLQKRGEPTKVDANYLSPSDFDRVLNYLEQLPIDPEQRLGSQVAAILGYFGMLRRGEVTRLRLGDCLLAPFPELLIQRTGEGAPKNGKARKVRWSPPNEYLDIIRDYIERYRKADRPEQPLLGGYRYTFSVRQFRYLYWIRIAMQAVTLDGTLRFHHLRHSGACNLILQGWMLLGAGPLTADNYRMLQHSIFSAEYKKQAWMYLAKQDEVERIDLAKILYLVAQALGHATPATTLVSYFHFPELLDASSEPAFMQLPTDLCRVLLGYKPSQTAYCSAQRKFTVQAPQSSRNANTRTPFSGCASDPWIDREAFLALYLARRTRESNVTVVAATTAALTFHRLNWNNVADIPYLLLPVLFEEECFTEGVIELGFWTEEQLEQAKIGIQRMAIADGWVIPSRQDRKAIFQLMSSDELPGAWQVSHQRVAHRWARALKALPIPSAFWQLTFVTSDASSGADMPAWIEQFDPPVRVVAYSEKDKARIGRLQITLIARNEQTKQAMLQGLRCWLIWLALQNTNRG